MVVDERSRKGMFKRLLSSYIVTKTNRINPVPERFFSLPSEITSHLTSDKYMHMESILHRIKSKKFWKMFDNNYDEINSALILFQRIERINK